MSNYNSHGYFSDSIAVLRKWRLIFLRASQSIRSRYIRSYLGQFWSVLSITLLIISTGLIWSFIWGVDAQQYLPYVACGHVIYLFVSGTINDSTSAILIEKRFFYKYNPPIFIAIDILLLRNLIVFLHNIPIIIMVILWSPAASFSIDATYLLYALMVVAFIYFASTFLAILCVYYRDMIQLIGSVLQISFLLTPVIWEVNRIPQDYQIYAYLNPFTSVIEVLRNPLIGEPVSFMAIYSLLCWLFITFILSYVVWRVKHKQLIFWI